jgi:hypothetical protein
MAALPRDNFLYGDDAPLARVVQAQADRRAPIFEDRHDVAVSRFAGCGSLSVSRGATGPEPDRKSSVFRHCWRCRQKINAIVPSVDHRPNEAHCGELSEWLFRKLLRFRRNVPPHCLFSSSQCEEDIMRKFAYLLAALGAMAVAVPSIASAETVVIKRSGHHHGWYSAHAQMYHHDRGWHRGWRHHHADKVVIIKHRHANRY